MNPVLEIDQGTFGYKDIPILRGITFRVLPGEVFAIVGPNSVGKTTLINAISGVVPTIEGSIRIAGQETTHLTSAERAQLVAVVPQATNLPHTFPVEDIVLAGRTPYLGWFDRESDIDREIANEALRRTQSADLADRVIGELSGGEQQRVLIARAIAQSTPVLLLDEPTAHLDLRHQDNILKLVRELASEQGYGILIALHDLNLVARFADRVALLSDGGIRRSGAPTEVLDPSELAAVYGIEIHVTTHPLHGSPLILTY